MTEVVISGAEESYTIQPLSGAVKKITFDKKIKFILSTPYKHIIHKISTRNDQVINKI